MSTEVLTVGQRSLRELAETANREHGLAVDAARTTLVHALNCGAALSEARAMVPAYFKRWVEENTQIAPSTASVYIRLFVYQELLSEDMTIRQAQLCLRGKPPAVTREVKNHWWAHPPEVKDEVVRLRNDGVPIEKIAEAVGVSTWCVCNWTDPSFAGKVKKRQAAYREEQRRAKKQLAEKDRQDRIKRAVRKAGAATAEAYSLAERMQDVLAQAQREQTDSEARTALSLAGQHYRLMRDQIVRALGVQ